MNEALALYASGLSIRQVAAQVGWSWSKTQTWLARHGATRSAGEGVHLAKGAVPLVVSEPLIEFVDGLLLGDASIEKASQVGTSRLHIGQSGDRRPWVYEIHHQLARFAVLSSLTEDQGGPVVIKGKRCMRKPRVELRTSNYAWFGEQRQRWYPDGIKRVPVDVRLSTCSIAGWYFGDGGVGGNGYRAQFCTDNFPVEDVEQLIDRLRHEYGWTPLHDVERNRILLCRADDRKDLVAMLGPITPECLRYKLDLRIEDHRRTFSPEQREELLYLRGQGWSLGRIAAHFGTSKSGISAICLEAGLGGAMNRPGPRKSR